MPLQNTTIKNDILELYRFDIEGYGATITGGGTVSKDAINIDFEGKKIDMGRCSSILTIR